MKPSDFSPRQWQIIELVGRDGLPWSEVSTRLDVSMGTLQSHVNRIRLRVTEERTPRELLTSIYYRATSGPAPSA